MTPHRRWRKSSHSQNGSDCMELAQTLDALRDSKNPTGPPLMVANLDTFLRDVKLGRFPAVAPV